MNNPPDCHACPLRDGAKQVVWGHGNESSDLMFVGESPGVNEDKQGRPMVGQSGRELDKYCRDVGIARYETFVDNVVKCHPPKDRDPKQEEIAACVGHLTRAIMHVQPRIIVALGAVATRWLLGDDANLEMMHGIPFQNESATVLPMYHPAYGLRETKMMALIQDDFKVLARLLKGEDVRGVEDAYPEPTYHFLVGEMMETHPPEHFFRDHLVVAVDTESAGFVGEPWCVSFSTEPGTGYVIKADNHTAIRVFANWVADPRVTTILHNALYDLPVLAKLGIYPAHVVCTMVGAYNLQRLPQGLKALAYRLVGMEMGSYAEQVAAATREKAWAYLSYVTAREWPNPEPLLTWDKGKPHIKQPQNIEKKALRIITDMLEKGADPWERWHNIDLDEGRGMVEEEMGPMIPGYLSDIPEEDAVYYAARDADATLRIWPLIEEMLDEAGL